MNGDKYEKKDGRGMNSGGEELREENEQENNNNINTNNYYYYFTEGVQVKAMMKHMCRYE